MLNTTISFGPLLIPLFMLALLASFIITTWILGRIAPRLDFDAQWTKGIIEKSFIVGFVMARLGFVARYWESYLDAPWTAFYVWQPGYSIVVGIISALAFAVWRVYQNRASWHRQSAMLLAGGVLTGATVFCLIIGLAWAVNDRDKLDSGVAIADFKLQDLDGNPVGWADLKGNAIILNFWATWCPPCLREMPLLDQTNQDYQSQGLDVIGISVGQSAETVRTFVDSIGVTYPIWVDRDMPAHKQTQAIFDRYGGVGLPTTLFIDRHGLIRNRYVGELSRGFIDSEVTKLLHGKN